VNIGYRTLKLVVDGHQGRHEHLSETEMTDRIETAGQEAGETVTADAGLDATVLANQLAAVVVDDQFIETVDEVADHDGLIVGEATAVAEALERQVDDEALDTELSDEGWKRAAAAFITALQRELVSTETETPSLVDSGRVVLQDGAFETAKTYLELSRDIAREVDDSAAEAAALVALGDHGLRSGALETAEGFYQAGLDIAREIGDSHTEAMALAGVGNVALQREDLETADEFHRESLEIAREMDDRSTEANSLASLGTIAGSRGAYEMAEQYLEESLDIKRLIGDDVGEATVLASLGNVAMGRDADEIATQRYTEALEQFAATDQSRERIQTLENLVTIERNRGNDAAAIDYCDDGLALLADTDLSGLDEADRWFRTTRAQLTGDPGAVDALYRAALDRISEDNAPAAFELLSGVWECRESFEPGTEPHGLCLRAGVGFAAYHLLLDTDSVETTHTELVAEISSHRAALSEPATVLYEFVKSGGADRDTEISVDDVDSDADGIDAEELPIDDLERRTYAAFLSRITETPPPAELYSRALTAIVQGTHEPREVVQLCLVAWEQRDDVDGERQSILGSMLLAEAHRETFDFNLPNDRQETFDWIADNRSVLSEPMAGLFDQLATGSTETTPDGLLAAADQEEPSLADVERMAVARFLDALQS
jgi:tetratricopeptide (TPR) repeat protein